MIRGAQTYSKRVCIKGELFLNPLDRFVLDRDLVHPAMKGWDWKGSVGLGPPTGSVTGGSVMITVFTVLESSKQSLCLMLMIVIHLLSSQS